MEKSGRDESFPPNLLMSQKFPFVTVQLELIYCPKLSKITKKKKPKSKAIKRVKVGRNKKCNKKKIKKQQAQESEQWPA